MAIDVTLLCSTPTPSMPPLSCTPPPTCHSLPPLPPNPQFDHHCGVFGRCVAEYNVRFFAGTIFFGGAALLVSVAGTVVREVTGGGFEGRGTQAWDVALAAIWIILAGYSECGGGAWWGWQRGVGSEWVQWGCSIVLS